MPAEKLVDTNGAGDAFVGGFLSQLVRLHVVLLCTEWQSLLPGSLDDASCGNVQCVELLGVHAVGGAFDGCHRTGWCRCAARMWPSACAPAATRRA